MNGNIKLKLLKILLFMGVGYYLVGGIAHLLGLTIFPFYVATLYSPYHDTVIALSSFTLTIILFAVAKNPEKNIDVLNGLILAGFLAIIFSFYILLKIDFPQTGMDKKFQTIVELILLIIYVVALLILKPRKGS
ncbi:MAG: hypothetical protein V1808_02905 [Candidatus Daviesbacteria bacterium]